ncbi:hypothetical protein IJV57_00985 [Candidatus Saccharibacteria bacterium]|nr:hypothetical protein [Candidatus Saccharibacteria bacterium]
MNPVPNQTQPIISSDEGLPKNDTMSEARVASMTESKPAKKKSVKKHILSWVISFCVGATLVYFLDYQAIIDNFTSLSYQPSTEMAQTIENIELTKKGTRIVRASKAELQNADDFNRNCPAVTAETSVLGCYDDWHIYVYDITNEELDGIKEAVLAHELLHAYWHREKPYMKEKLEPILRRVYETHEGQLKEHMKTYSEENFVDELHSIIGVELKPSELPQDLRDHYGKVFKNHDKIHSYFEAYNGKFVSLQNEMNEQLNKINSMRAQIDSLTESYRKKSEQLASDIDVFNRRASDGYYADRGSFNADRAALVARQAALNEEYQKLSKLVDEANEIVKQYNQNVARSSELYGSINSNFKKEEDITKQ